MAIDWDFIGTLEGQSVLDAYVPDPETSQSGVTIATGVDLGQLSVAELAGFGLSAELTAKLQPYVGLRQQAAAAYLAANPLHITKEESDALDQADRRPDINGLTANYAAAIAPGAPGFDGLPDPAQTVLASVSFQYGPNLAVRAPRFWRTAVNQDWQGMIAELRNFGDKYPTRRNKEANYLQAGLA
jgi:hypothetical protein